MCDISLDVSSEEALTEAAEKGLYRPRRGTSQNA
jgi:hypothetical protein